MTNLQQLTKVTVSHINRFKCFLMCNLSAYSSGGEQVVCESWIEPCCLQAGAAISGMSDLFELTNSLVYLLFCDIANTIILWYCKYDRKYCCKASNVYLFLRQKRKYCCKTSTFFSSFFKVLFGFFFMYRAA